MYLSNNLIKITDITKQKVHAHQNSNKQHHNLGEASKGGGDHW